MIVYMNTHADEMEAFMLSPGPGTPTRPSSSGTDSDVLSIDGTRNINVKLVNSR